MEGNWGTRPKRGAVVLSALQIGFVCGLEAGIIPFNSLPADLPKPEDPPLSSMAIAAGNFIAPGIWGIEAVGADLARKDLKDIQRTAVNVVVSYAGVKVGALRSIEVPGKPKQRNMIRLRLVKNVGEGSEIDWGSKLIDWWNKIVPEEIPDPTDPTMPMDTNHASHVAGVIGALNPDFGVSPYAEISDMNIFKGMNLFEPANLAAGLNVLLDQNIKVDVMNMSHMLPKDPEVRGPIHRLVTERDTIVVVAAGNEGSYLGRNHPLNMARDVVVVGAIGLSGALTHFSNFGASLDIVAPGEMIVSRGEGMRWRNENLEIMSGTSMATPFVTGTFATLRALLPEARSKDLKTLVYKSASDIGKKGKDYFYGRGLLNTLKAVAVARRLIDGGLTSEGAIAQAMTVDENFDFEEDARAAVIEARKLGFGSSEFEDGFRRRTLLLSTPDAFKELGALQLITGQSTRGFGWLYMAANSEANTPLEKELETVANLTWNMQVTRAEAFGDAFSLLNNLSNVNLALKMYEVCPPEVAAQFTPFFTKKVASLDASRMKDFGSLVAQKKIEHATTDLIAAISMGN